MKNILLKTQFRLHDDDYSILYFLLFVLHYLFLSFKGDRSSCLWMFVRYLKSYSFINVVPFTTQPYLSFRNLALITYSFKRHFWKSKKQFLLSFIIFSWKRDAKFISMKMLEIITSCQTFICLNLEHKHMDFFSAFVIPLSTCNALTIYDS